MDNGQLIQLLLAAVASNGSHNFSNNDSLFPNDPYSVQGYQGLLPEKGSLFGGLGDFVARFIPGMTYIGPDGQPTPIFKTNLRATPTGMSGFAHLNMRQNELVFGAASKAYGESRAGKWREVTDDNSKLAKNIDKANASDTEKIIGHGIRKIFGNEITRNMFSPKLDELLGYKRNLIPSVVNQYSPQISAAYLKRNMPSDLYQNVIYNPFGDDALKTRTAVNSLLTASVDEMMFDGEIRKTNMHGISADIVSSFMSKIAATGRFDDKIQDRVRLSKELEDVTEKRKTAEELLQSAKNPKEADELNTAIKAFTAKINEINGSLDKLTTDLAKDATPMAEQLTNAISSLTDLYGDEREAARAFDRLTGGKWAEKGADVAGISSSLADKLRDIKILTGVAGLDPSFSGKLIENYRQGVRFGNSNIANYSAYQGSMALAFTEDALMRATALGPENSKQVQDYLKGHAAAARAFNDSKAQDFALLLQVAKKDNKVDDQLYQQLYKMSASGNKSDFFSAQGILAKALFGSTSGYTDFTKDRSMMALISRKLSPEESEAAAKHGVEMRSNVDNKNIANSSLLAGITTRIKAAKEAGISGKEISTAIDYANSNAVGDILFGDKKFGESDDEFIARKASRIALSEQYKEAKKKYPQKSEKELKAIAFRRWKQLGFDKGLNSDVKSRLEQQYLASKQGAIEDLLYFDDKQSLMSASKGSIFEKVKATDDDGNMTRAGFKAASDDIFKNLSKLASNNSATRANGSKISKAQVSEARKAFNKAFNSGNYEEAKRIVERLDPKLLSTTTLSQLVTNARDGGYLKKKDIDTWNDPNYNTSTIGKAQADQEFGKTTNNSLSNDERVLYADGTRIVDASKLKEGLGKANVEVAKQEKEAESDSRSDLEKAVQLFQNGEVEKFFEIFRNGNGSLEAFYDLIKNIVVSSGGYIGGDFLELGGVNMSERLNSIDEKTAVSYFNVLSGHTKDADIKDIKEQAKVYNKYMQEAREGKSESYITGVEMENFALQEGIEHFQGQKDELLKSVKGDQKKLSPEQVKMLNDLNKEIDNRKAVLKKNEEHLDEIRNIKPDDENNKNGKDDKNGKNVDSQTPSNTKFEDMVTRAKNSANTTEKNVVELKEGFQIASTLSGISTNISKITTSLSNIVGAIQVESRGSTGAV